MEPQTIKKFSRLLLGTVDNHLEAMSVAARFQLAA